MKIRPSRLFSAITLFVLLPLARQNLGAASAAPAGAPAASPNQAYTQTSPAFNQTSPATSAPASSASGQTSGTPENSNVWSIADKMLNSDSLNVDSEKGVFTWHNSKFDIGNNLIVRLRFERYLSSPGYPDTAQTYQQVLQQIHDLLSNDSGDSTPLTDEQKEARVFQAWEMLFTAAKYPEDGRASETLANQISNSWRVRAELSNNREASDAILAQEKAMQKTLGADIETARTTQDAENDINHLKPKPVVGGSSSANNAKLLNPSSSSSTSNNSGGNQTHSNGNNFNTDGVTTTTGSNQLDSLANNLSNSTNNSSGGGGNDSGNGGSGLGPDPLTQPLGDMTGAVSGVVTQQVAGLGGATGPSLINPAMDSADLARLYTKENLLDADAFAMGLQAKLQYQTQLLSFIAQRRFQHSLMAGEFYEHLFKGSQQRLNVAQQQISRYINTDNIVPSVLSFESMSHEAINEVDNSMKAVESAYAVNDLWTSLEQLQQAFLLGENLPSVQQFDPAKRRVLLKLYRQSNDLRHMLEIHDFAGAEDTLKSITSETKDFEAASPVLSAIREGEQTSNNLVMAAGQAAVAGDTDRVTDDLQKATQLWPLNPEISKFSETMLKRINAQDVGTKKFDDLLARGDDRAIYEAKNEIGLAVSQDPDRLAKLSTIVNRVGQVEMAILFADQAMKQNNGYAAWESLQSAAEIEPNDPALAVKMREVATRVPNFAAALDSADRAAKSGQYAVALNDYLQAQDIYPASRICSERIQDLSMKLMAKLNPKGPSAKALADQPMAAPQNPPSSNATTPSSNASAPTDKNAAPASGGNKS